VLSQIRHAPLLLQRVVQYIPVATGPQFLNSTLLYVYLVSKMALPAALRTSVTPLELELMASEHLVDIVPLVAMERTAFISVSSKLYSSRPARYLTHVLAHLGCIRAFKASAKMQGSHLDGY
jgi:hypothetical protein